MKRSVFTTILAILSFSASASVVDESQDMKMELANELISTGIYNEANAIDFVQKLSIEDSQMLIDVIKSEKLAAKDSVIEIWGVDN